MFICYKFKWSEHDVMLMEIDQLIKYNDWLTEKPDPKNEANKKADKINQRIRKIKKGE